VFLNMSTLVSLCFYVFVVCECLCVFMCDYVCIRMSFMCICVRL